MCIIIYALKKQPSFYHPPTGFPGLMMYTARGLHTPLADAKAR